MLKLLEGLLVLSLFIFTSSDVLAGFPYKEGDYVNKFCSGEIEKRTSTGLRVDCVQGGYAMEYDWAHKWAECIGQGLEYGRSEGLEAACVLIVKSDRDFRYVKRLNRIVRHYGLPLTIIVVGWEYKSPMIWPEYRLVTK